MISKSQSSFALLTIQLTELQSTLKGKIQAKVDEIIETGKKFTLEHEESLLWIRKIKQRLFELTEQLAAKEIEQDPKGYILHESYRKNSPVKN